MRPSGKSFSGSSPGRKRKSAHPTRRNAAISTARRRGDCATTRLQVERFVQAGHLDATAPQMVGEMLHDRLFAVNEKCLLAPANAGVPGGQLSLVGVGGESEDMPRIEEGRA